MEEVKRFSNTGILFEILTRQAAIESLQKLESPAEKILTQYFTGTELLKEVYIYKQFCELKGKNPYLQLQQGVQLFQELDQSKIVKEKKQVLKEFKEVYPKEILLEGTVPYQNTYLLLEQVFRQGLNNSSKQVNLLLEAAYGTKPEVKSPQENQESTILSEIAEQGTEKQSEILLEYLRIGHIPSKLSAYYQKESSRILTEIRSKIKQIEDPTVKIQLYEAYKYLKQDKQRTETVPTDIEKLMLFEGLLESLKEVL